METFDIKALFVVLLELSLSLPLLPVIFKVSAPFEPAAAATSRYQTDFSTIPRFGSVGFSPKSPFGSIGS